MFPCINVQQNMTDEKVYFLVIYLSEKIIRAETVYFIKTTLKIYKIELFKNQDTVDISV